MEHRTAISAKAGAQERSGAGAFSHAAADMVSIPAGSFRMGSPASELEALLRSLLCMGVCLSNVTLLPRSLSRSEEIGHVRSFRKENVRTPIPGVPGPHARRKQQPEYDLPDAISPGYCRRGF